MENELVIRTMKDDIAEIESATRVASEPFVNAKHEKQKSPIFTLPLKKTTSLDEAVITPNKKLRSIAKIFVYVVFFFAIAGGGFYGYMNWDNIQKLQILQKGPNQEVSFPQIIPKETLALVRYAITSDENRNLIRQMWSTAGSETGKKATSGDPTNLLQISDISQVYYFVLPGNQSPFLLIEKTEGTKEYVSQYREDQVVEQGNWYVLHASKVGDYNIALASGSIAEDSTLLASSDSSSYLIRYAVSAEFASRQFTTTTATAIGLSQVKTLVFHVMGTTSDDTIRASALITGDPPGEGVVEGTTELMSLVPNDITFGRVGFNFAEDIELLQEDTTQFDTSVLAQPAVRLFLTLFKTPYALFERKGSDGVPDIGLIMALPGSLKQKIKPGESIVEQSLPVLIPLIIGKALGIQVAFNDGLYSSVPLRYVNLVGQTQTLDYSVGDNFLLISSSREGMEALIDTSLAQKKGLSMDEPWKSLTEKATEIIKDRLFIIGSITDPAMMSILPVASTMNHVPVIVSSGRTSTGVDIQLVLSTK